jgi:hypothetical protein
MADERENMMEANGSGNYFDQELAAWDDKSHATLL